MTEEAQKPRILVSGQITACEEEGTLKPTQSVRHMMKSLRAQGAEPVLVDHRDGYKRDDLLAADGIVFMGNDNDIDPAVYGAERDPNTCPETERCERSNHDFEMAKHRSTWEMAAMEDALDLGVPTLGICAGMQRMNVVGLANRDGSARDRGTLHQHIEGMWQEEDMTKTTKHLRIENGTRLATMAADITSDQNTLAINSRQHQAVKEIAKGFKATAFCDQDGADKKTQTIQAIELDDPHRFAMGVQWHPEFLKQSPLSEKIFASLTDAARDRMEAKAMGAGSYISRAITEKPGEQVTRVA